MKRKSILLPIILTCFFMAGCSNQYSSQIKMNSADGNQNGNNNITSNSLNNKTTSTKNPEQQIPSPSSASPSVSNVQSGEYSGGQIKITSSKLGISFDLPASWKDKFRIKETEASVIVYFKPDVEIEDGKGRFFTILKKSRDSDQWAYDDAVSFQYNGKDYIAGKPTDITYFEDDPEYSTYKKMAADVDKILKELAGNQQEVSFYGNWSINRQLAYGPVGTYSNEDIKNMLGRKLTFSKEKATCFGDQIKYLDDFITNPEYNKSIIPKTEFESNYRVTFSSLGVESDSIIKISVDTSNGKSCIFFIKDNDTLILYGGGVFLELVKV